MQHSNVFKAKGETPRITQEVESRPTSMFEYPSENGGKDGNGEYGWVQAAVSQFCRVERMMVQYPWPVLLAGFAVGYLLSRRHVR